MACRLLPSVAAAVLALSQIVAGVNMTFMDGCTDFQKKTLREGHSAAYFNATSSTSFTMLDVTGYGDNWFLYLTISDRSHIQYGVSFLHYWLAVPDEFLADELGNRTHVYIGTSNPHDKSLEYKNGNETCKGVVSDECIKGYTENIAMADFSSGQVPLLDSDFQKKCDAGLTSGSGPLSKDKTCFLSNLDGVVVPKGYGILPLVGGSYGDPKDESSLKAYHKMITQVSPTFLTFVERNESSGRNETKVLTNQVICAIPNDLQHDSKGPAESDGEMLQPSFAALAVLIALSVALV